ncbi:MAG: hypothetical protein PQJ60_09095 [Spirochaetales bacterium]|nr:hypothetical protein [Spirochaetales bacterium]
MKTGIPRKYLLAPFLLIAISLYFLTLHFIKLERFSGVVGNINYIGRRTSGSLLVPAKTKNLTVSFNGMEFNFTPFSQLIITTSDGIKHPLVLQEYKAENDRITVIFDKNVSLIFISDIHSKKVTLLPNLPLTIPPIHEITLPAGMVSDFSLVKEEDNELYKLAREEENYYITIPSDTIMDLENNRIFLDVSNNIIKSIVLEETLSGTGRSLADWYEKEGALLNSMIYNTSLDQYMTRVIQSLQNHLDTRTALITKPDGDGSPYFSEEGLAAFVMGAIPRGQYNNVVSMLKGGVTRQSSQMTCFSSPFFDDVVNKGNALIVDDWRKASTYQEWLIAKNTTLLTRENLVEFFDSQVELYRQTEALFLFAAEKPSEEEDFATLLGRMAIQLEYIKKYPDRHRENSLDRIIEILQSRTFWIKDDLLLFDDQGIAEIEPTLQFGSLLIRYSDLLDDEELLASGWKYILSCLKYSTIDGYIPERIVYTNQAEPETEGAIPPEEIYVLLSNSSYNPRRISLKNQLGAGSWGYTASSKMTVKSTPRETVINVDFPIGSEHYFIVRGVSPFTELQLHGIRWKSDRSFQLYSDGWLYDKSKNTLYVKIRHRRATETIRILHYDPAAETETVPETSTETEAVEALPEIN